MKKLNLLKNKKWIVLIVSLFLIFSFATTGTFAWFVDKTGTLTNNFIPAKVSHEISNSDTTGFAVTNTGNVPSYVKFTLVNLNTNKVLYMQEEGTDYFGFGNSNVTGDNFNEFYLTNPLNPGDSVDISLNTIYWLSGVNLVEIGTNGSPPNVGIIVKTVQTYDEAIVEISGDKVKINADKTLSKIE